MPCYNEACRLDVAAFEDFLRMAEGIDFLFVDDGSTDQTAAILADLKERYPESVEVHSLSRNSGKAEAVRTGVLKAFESNPDHIGMWDADLATGLTEIHRFVEILQTKPGILFVNGARVRMMGHVIERSAARHYIGRVAATLISLALRRPYYDTQCGAKLFRATRLVRELFLEPFGSSWIFDVELLARLDACSRKNPDCDPDKCVYELPLSEWRDKGGSKIRPSDYFFSLMDLWKIVRKYFW